ncbi:ABC transporter ATP-binding protein [Pseudomonas sp. S3E12]|jgi:peptide/nickel transport system ATP-binding protein|uniref:ABC transporter ATP-binding protein n=1 Tax=Pseudomonas sp. S3E12 TaxID=1873126 RepID=UPI00081BD72A|nr:ATP-binding cassette domain-containing protein [Pseudomonas sp. S3E12]OCW24040.1 peptide ABC transporter ATP-binding protein [Pseudomonas sp. S3E12]
MSIVDIGSLNVGFKRGLSHITALHVEQIQVEPGECFGLIGGSGSGKSTLLRVLAGLQRDWQGSVQLFDQPLAARRAFTGTLRRDVQMVFQDPYASLHPLHRIRRSLREPRQVNGLPFDEASLVASLEQVGLPGDVLERFPHQLSGGQRQRIAIVRALQLRPRLLLLDESTSALDMTVQAEILNLLQALRRDTGTTMILVSHDMNTVAHLCDRALLIKQGRVEQRLDRAALSALAGR